MSRALLAIGFGSGVLFLIGLLSAIVIGYSAEFIFHQDQVPAFMVWWLGALILFLITMALGLFGSLLFEILEDRP